MDNETNENEKQMNRGFVVFLHLTRVNRGQITKHFLTQTHTQTPGAHSAVNHKLAHNLA